MRRLTLCILAASLLLAGGCAMDDLFNFLTGGPQNSNDYTQQDRAASYGRKTRP